MVWYNDIKLEITEEELVQIVLDSAQGKLNDKDVENWISQHIKSKNATE